MNIESSLAIFGLPGGMEWVFILIAALLIFGRRLPDVARSIGRSIVEFKKGVRDIRDEVDHESQVPPPSRLDRQEPAPISPEPTNEPTMEPTNAAPTAPLSHESNTAPIAPLSHESPVAPVAPSSPTPQPNDS